MQKDEEKKISKERFFKALKIFNYLKPYKWYFGLGLFALVFSSSTVMIVPKLIGGLVDVSTGKSFYKIENRNTLGLVFIAVFILQGFLSFLILFISVLNAKFSIVQFFGREQ